MFRAISSPGWFLDTVYYLFLLPVLILLPTYHPVDL